MEAFSSPEFKYVALSYCWGDTTIYPAFKTNTANLLDHIRGIKKGTIPKTIQDAIIVTRAMGLRYLWIDALCIIQDSKEDWQRESVRMMDVYNNAYFTIVAARGSHSHAGFLQPRIYKSATIHFQSKKDSRIFGTYQLSARASANGDPKIRQPLSLIPAIVETPYALDVENSVWSRRGWTFQELMMSRRSLVFSERLYYKCQQSLRAEFRITELYPIDISIYDSLGLSQSKQDIYNFWYDTITVYVGLELTYPEDRLPAISGIAQQVAKACGDRYYAGIWEGDLIRGLLWSNYHYRERSETYVAPSWSWASQEHRIRKIATFPNYQHLETVKVIDIQTIPIGDNSMGCVSSGHLILEGKVVWFTASDPSMKLFWNTVEPELLQVEIGRDMLIGAVLLLSSLQKEEASRFLPGRWVVHQEGLVLTKDEHTGDCTRIGSFSDKSSKDVPNAERLDIFDECPTETVKII
jgi:hypothetical protein